MVAGDTKRVVVIKNISSNLIEEAILILKSGTDGVKGDQPGKTSQGKSNARNDFILKEAERIIDDYINGNGLGRTKDRRGARRWSPTRRRTWINILINVLLTAAVALLIFVAGKAL